MSGIKPITLTQLHRSLHARGTDLGALAAAIFTSRSHLSEVVSGHRPGTPTWRRIVKARLFTSAELALLGRDADGNPLVATTNVPRATFSHVEQIPTEACV